MNLKLGSLSEYKIGNTSIYRADTYCATGNRYLKLEYENLNMSIKDRTAYFMIKNLIEEGKLKEGVTILESTSGNLGVSLAHFANELHSRFICLVDPTISKNKLDRIKEKNADIEMVSISEVDVDYRSARIRIASELDSLPGHIWVNQYENLSNFKAHFETTGPEIWEQTEGELDYIVCAVGSGGTVSGIGKYLKQKKSSIKIIAVEPYGSTIFGGEQCEYLSAGAGLINPSGIIKRFMNVIDETYKVKDADSISECLKIRSIEGLSVGITSGMTLAVASKLAKENPGKKVMAISSDSGDNYSDILQSYSYNNVG